MKAFKFIILAIAYILFVIAFIVDKDKISMLLFCIGNGLFFAVYFDLLINGME
jgi:hypothetical protein